MITQCHLYSYAPSTVYFWGRRMHRNVKIPHCRPALVYWYWYNNICAQRIHWPFGAKKALMPSGFVFFFTLAAGAFLGVGPPSCSSKAKW